MQWSLHGLKCVYFCLHSIPTIPLHMNGSSSVNSALAGTALIQSHMPHERKSLQWGSYCRKVLYAAVAAELFLGSVSLNHSNVSQSSDGEFSFSIPQWMCHKYIHATDLCFHLDVFVLRRLLVTNQFMTLAASLSHQLVGFELKALAFQQVSG